MGDARGEAAAESEDDELAQEEADLKAAIQARRATFHAFQGVCRACWTYQIPC